MQFGGRGIREIIQARLATYRGMVSGPRTRVDRSSAPAPVRRFTKTGWCPRSVRAVSAQCGRLILAPALLFVTLIGAYASHIDPMRALRVAFFVASVDRVSGSVKLYCAHRLSDAFITNHDRETLTIYLDDRNTADELAGQDVADVHIGPPVMEWSLETLFADAEFSKRFYDVPKEHIKVAKASLSTRNVGWVEYVRWSTNELPKRIGYKIHTSRPADENLNRAADAMAPYFFVWQQEVLRTGNWEAARDIFSLLEKTKKIIESGMFPLSPRLPQSSNDSTKE